MHSMRWSLYSTACLLALAVVFPASTCAETVVLEPVQDNSIYEEDGTLSNGAGIFLFMGVTAEGNRRRALLAFDIAGSLPAEASITEATLSIEYEPKVPARQNSVGRLKSGFDR